MKTVCLLCGLARVETLCGDQSCPCTGGPHWSGTRIVAVRGLEYRPRFEISDCERVYLGDLQPVRQPAVPTAAAP